MSRKVNRREFMGAAVGATALGGAGSLRCDDADYFTHKAADGARTDGGSTGGAPDLWENLTPINRMGYLTHLLSDKAIEIITRRRDKPFFLSLQYNAPHSPWEGPEDAAIGHTDHGSSIGSMRSSTEMNFSSGTRLGHNQIQSEIRA